MMEKKREDALFVLYIVRHKEKLKKKRVFDVKKQNKKLRKSNLLEQNWDCYVHKNLMKSV